MTVPSDWIPHRRADGELLGWMQPSGEGFVLIDLLARPISAALDWFEAESLLDNTGIGYLAEPFELLLDDGRWPRVRLTEVSTDAIVVKREDWGAIDIPAEHYTLPFPIPDTLRPRAAAG